MPLADLVLAGGPVFTADPARPWAGAVAAKDGRVLAVSDLADDLADLVGPRTERVDLAGGLLVPGFQDAHVHPVWAGVELGRCSLDGLPDAEAYLREVAAYSAEHPTEEWVLGSGWSLAVFPGGTPTAAALDRVVPDRPVYLTNADHHGAWVNTTALRLAGIDAATPDPADGRIERGPDGTPTGALHEGAMALVARLLPEPSVETLTQGLLTAQERLHSLGVTAWQDAIIGDYLGAADVGAAYLAAGDAGLLTARVRGALWWRRDRGLEQVPELVARRDTLGSERFSPGTVKVMQDGTAENFTASLLRPYCDGHGHPTDNSGISFVAPDVLSEAVAELDGHGFQLHFHAIGDAAVRQCLDAVGTALRRNGRRDARHHIAHVQVVHPDDVPRFAELGVVANIQAVWATYDEQMVDLTLPFLPEVSRDQQYPFGDLVRSGAALAAGSDWPVSTPDPLTAIHVAVNRALPAADENRRAGYGPFLPEQRIDLATALTAYTAGSAYVNHLDDTGTIRAGALADLAVLDRDPFEGPVEQIGSTRVLQTFIDGKRVHAAPDA